MVFAIASCFAGSAPALERLEVTAGSGRWLESLAALHVKRLDGRIVEWIDVGAPAPDRLHRAAKLAERVVVWCHRRPDLLQQRCAKERVHRASEITVVKVPTDTPAPAGDGIDWADAGIGAAGVLGLALIAVGGSIAVVKTSRTSRTA